jgi:general secretion pathway protein M
MSPPSRPEGDDRRAKPEGGPAERPSGRPGGEPRTAPPEAAPAKPAAALRPGAAWLAPLRERWRGLSTRDRRGVALAAAVLGAFVLWSAALQPALRTLREAPAQLDALDAQLQQMQALASEAAELRNAPAVSQDQAAQALQAASARLGPKGRLVLQGDRAVLTLNGASGTQLREWLADARAGARARPAEAQLTRGAQGFSGTIVVALGAAR